MNTRVSVVTVCYNAVDDIEKTMLSVLDQTYENIEYIVIDGGSTDGTVEVIKKYEKRLAYWVSEPDKGIYDAMNKGLDFSTGEWINFMNAGDVFYSESTVNSIFQSGDLSSFYVVYGDCIIKSGEKCCYQKASSIRKLRSQMVFCHQSSFIKNVGIRFRVDLKIASDYALFLSYLKCYSADAFIHFDIPVSIFDANGISYLNTKLLRTEYSSIYAENRNYYYYYDLFKQKIKSLLCWI